MEALEIKKKKKIWACFEGHVRTCGGEIQHMQTFYLTASREQRRLSFVFSVLMQTLKPCCISFFIF